MVTSFTRTGAASLHRIPHGDDWFRRFLPGRRLDPAKGHRVGSSQLVVEFARRGLGIALGQMAMAEEHLSSGQLVPLSDDALPIGDDYCAVHPRAKLRKAGLALLIEHLRIRAPRR
jgi:DNA-binding transcriptional LysR family regulator